MGWPLPLHVLIKITRECKTDFLNASCLFFFRLSPLPLFSCCFLGGFPGWCRTRGYDRFRIKEARLAFCCCCCCSFLFDIPASETFFVFFGHLSPFSLLFSLAGGFFFWFGADRPTMGRDENGNER